MNHLKRWLPQALILTLLLLALYISLQQTLRQQANDPQIQLAEDTAQSLERGVPATTLISTTTVELSRSLAPFIMIVRSDGSIVASSGVIDGKAQKPPQGVLDYARTHGQHRVTWQPRSDIRQALVVQPYNDGWVIAGRSLRQTEIRIQQLGTNLLIGWIFSLIASYTLLLLLQLHKK